MIARDTTYIANKRPHALVKSVESLFEEKNLHSLANITLAY